MALRSSWERRPAKAITSACNLSFMARSPSGIKAWIIESDTVLSSTLPPIDVCAPQSAIDPGACRSRCPFAPHVFPLYSSHGWYPCPL